MQHPPEASSGRDSRRSLRRASPVLAAALLLAGLSVLAAVLDRRLEITRARDLFDSQAATLATKVQHELDVCVDLADAVEHLGLAAQDAPGATFSAFAQGARTGTPGLQAMGYAPRVPLGGRPAFEALLARNGHTGGIAEPSPSGGLQPAGERAAYYPVLHVEPLAENQGVAGFDLACDPQLLETLLRAARTAETTASPARSLMQGARGFLLIRPVYSGRTPAQDPVERLETLQGFTLAVVRVPELLQAALRGEDVAGLDILLMDRSDPTADEELIHGVFRAVPAHTPGGLSAAVPLKAPGRGWSLVVRAGPERLTQDLSATPWIILAAGLAATALVCLSLFKSLHAADMTVALARERAKAELALRDKLTILEEADVQARESERMLQSILVGIRAATVTLDPESFAILDLNGIAEQLFGISRHTWIGRNYRELAARLKPLEQSLAGQPAQQEGALAFAEGEFLLDQPGGKLVPVSRTILNTAVGPRRYLFDILFDISEKKAMERQLGLAQKLESIGQLASGIAHEINTPIQYVGGNLGFLKDAFEALSAILARHEAVVAAARAGEPLEAPLAELERAKAGARYKDLLGEIPDSITDSIAGVERVALIVGAMKKFSHPDLSDKRLVDVNKAIESTLTISRNEWKYDAELTADYAPDLPLVLCAPGDFNQVILNVVVNAAHAVSERFHGLGRKGRIAVSTARDGDFVVITVRDTGVGIPKENLERIFDPFFTTKEVGKGTGQGLAIVHAVVSRHGGSIQLESVPGEGTTFTIRFPSGQGGAGA